MDPDSRCGDFVLANQSSSTEARADQSWDKFLKKPHNKPKASSLLCESPPGDFLTSSSLSSVSSGLMSQNYSSTTEPLLKVPNIGYEVAVAKSIMQQLSSISGDNLFDHLSDIIKRVIDERPPNVIDFFEEFSHNIRKEKLHLPESFPPDSVFEEKRLYKLAKKQLSSMNLPCSTDVTIRNNILKSDFKQEDLLKFPTFNDRVQHMQFYWNQCGLSISSEDIFQLACSMNRLQNHPSIRQCRFWGIINGLKASYFIVEGTLTTDEYKSRLLQMQDEMQEHIVNQHLEDAKNQQKVPSHIGPELTPGAVGWENYAEAEILKMKPDVLPVPLAKNVETFDIPPEPIGRGVNRYSYYVVNSLSDEWTELPIVTPRQICTSRHIKKFFTGDLEEDVVSYPCFSGKEKHYLRAMIARITAGTYIAPKNYYRKMTKYERRLFEGDVEDDDGEEEEEESQAGEEEEQKENEPDNDVVLIKNEKYDSSIPLHTLNYTEKWVHVRPNILRQGRVVWYDQEKSEREKRHKRSANIHSEDSMDEEESDNSAENEESEDEELQVHPEKGPAILTSCSRDANSETPVPWVGRFNSKFTNQNERILVMQSNVWPGACTFLFKDLCESIYLGWGHKRVSRNMPWKHLEPIQEEYKHTEQDFIESVDPSVEIEEDYKLTLLRNEKETINVEMDEYGAVESSADQDDDDDDEEEEEEEEEE